jgi:uncharacterized protein
VSRSEFTGYASLFGKKDSSNDIVVKGAFKNSLAKRRISGIRMLFQHEPSQPIGNWIDIREDKRGLWVHGSFDLEVQRARELSSLLENGGIDGLSIGFKTIRSRNDKGIRSLLELDLWEISIVTFPMLTGARARLLK